MADKGPNKPVNVAIPPDAHALISDYCERRGLILRDTVGKVLRWFCGQEGPAQRAILGDVDGEVTEAYAAILEDMAKGLRESEPPPRITHIKNNKVTHPRT